jgi:hypothetical protein
MIHFRIISALQVEPTLSSYPEARYGGVNWRM